MRQEYLHRSSLAVVVVRVDRSNVSPIVICHFLLRVSEDTLITHYTYTLSWLGAGCQVPESKPHLGTVCRRAQTRTSCPLGLATRASVCRSDTWSWPILTFLTANRLREALLSRPAGGEAYQRLPLSVRRSCPTHCLNESSSSLHTSLAGSAGAVSLQHLASDFPPLPSWFADAARTRRQGPRHGK